MMLEELLASYQRFRSFSSSWIAIQAIEPSGSGRSLTMRWNVKVAPGDETEWKIDCRGVREVAIRALGGNELHLTDSHPVLRRHTEPGLDLYFKGVPDNPAALIGELYLAHRRIFGDWTDPAVFLNRGFSNLEDLLVSGLGLLASGPGSVIQEQRAVLGRHGVSARLLDRYPSELMAGGSAAPDDGKVQALILDETFVVARQFSAVIVG